MDHLNLCLVRCHRLLRAVGSAHCDLAAFGVTTHPEKPRVAADLAILDEFPQDIRLEEDLNLLTAIGAGDEKVVFHQGKNPTNPHSVQRRPRRRVNCGW